LFRAARHFRLGRYDVTHGASRGREATMTYVSWGFTALYFASLLLIRWVLLLKKKAPASSVAWIMAIVGLPLLGGLLFLVFGVNRVERRAMGKKALARRRLGPNLPELSQYQVLTGEGRTELQTRLMKLTNNVNPLFPTFGNRIDVLDETPRTLALIEEAIRSAQETLHVEYYIWRADRTGTHLRDMLIQKAREGVTVRFLYDGIGSIMLSRRFLRPMTQAGIRVAGFLPGRTLLDRWSINLRNHRKILVVDGQVAFTGGMNIGDEYLGKNPYYGFWRDTHLRLRGPAVLHLQQVFVEDWLFATNEELTLPQVFPAPLETGNVDAQVVLGEPIGEFSIMHSVQFEALNEARKQVLLATSYFVPPESLVTALETAAHRGVRVRLLLAGKATYPWTLLAGRSYYEGLLRAGVEIYEYERGLMHAKTLTVDGEWSLVGTPNFDTRSLFLNFEVAVATYDERIASQLEEQFERDVKQARRIELERWMQRPEMSVVVENTWRLFAPVL
jgi:cardiolipin synthase